MRQRNDDEDYAMRDHRAGMIFAFSLALIFSINYTEQWVSIVFLSTPLIVGLIAYYTSAEEHLGLAALFALGYSGVCLAPAMLVARGVHLTLYTPPNYPGNEFTATDGFIYNTFLMGAPLFVLGAIFWAIAAGIAKKLDEEPY